MRGRVSHGREEEQGRERRRSSAGSAAAGGALSCLLGDEHGRQGAGALREREERCSGTRGEQRQRRASAAGLHDVPVAESERCEREKREAGKEGRGGAGLICGAARRQGGCSRGQALEPRGSRSSSPWCGTRTESGDTRGKELVAGAGRRRLRLAGDLGGAEITGVGRRLWLEGADLRWMVVGSVGKTRRRPGGLAAAGGI